jgi:hypothetical protein
MAKPFFSRSVAICVLIVAIAAPAAYAVENPIGQLLDVSKQVSSIQKKVDKVVAKDGLLPPADLLASADCGSVDTDQVFQAWDDQADYLLAPQGDLAATDQWTLGKGAVLSADHDPYSTSVQSILLPAGSQVATPAICVDLSKPSIRLFVKNNGDPSSALRVDVLYQDEKGKSRSLTIASLQAGNTWEPSIVLPIYLNALAASSATGLTAVAFQFSPEAKGNSSWQLDGLYVDPFKGR